MQTHSLIKKTFITLRLIIALTLFLPGQTFSQTENTCGQPIVTENWLNAHLELRKRYDEFQREHAGASPTCANRTTDASAPNYTIPVVFHILHIGGPENISDAQVKDAVAILNRDYQKKNADTINVVSTYTNNIAKVNFGFELAKLDPDGNCTNGIIRHYTPKTNWNANDLSWFTYSWPREKYLNIYIVKSINIAATAYAFLPPVNVPPSADCIVCMHMCCGSIGTGILANSRTLTHEVAHWFNIPHIWGSSNSPGVACGDDGINDTPVTKGFTSCNLANANVCNPLVYENVQNYMDYSPCKIMFTNGQSTVMNNIINSSICDRNNLSTPANLQATGITTSSSNCIPLVDIETLPAYTVCLGTPITLKSYTSNAEATTYLWTATNGGFFGSPTSANTSFSLNTPGSSLVTCVASNSNGATSASMVVTVANSVAQVTTTSLESFETFSWPANWTVLNPSTPNASWDIQSSAGSAGNQCVFVNGENTPPGSVEILQTPSYDFLNNPGSLFTFKCAYARQTTTHKDIFKVQASKDCGGSWTDVLTPSANFLSLGSGEVSSVVFYPYSNHWKSYDVTQSPQFTSFLDQANVKFRFYFKEDTVTGFGNRIYLDQINFETPTGFNEYTKAISLNVFPNPLVSSLNIEFTLSDPKHVHVYLTSVSGAIVMDLPASLYDAGYHNTPMNNLNTLAAGIYFVNMEFDGVKVVRKVMAG